MSDTVVAESPAASPAKRKSSKSKAASVKPSHPKVSLMVNVAITELKERGGSSLQAIKKYIASTYKVDAEKLAPFIRKHLKSAVASGSLIQTKGKGASGSFKVGGGKKVAPPPPKAAKKAVSKPAKAKAPKVKKAAVKVKPARAAKPKKVSKVKAKKSPAKAPKPKKTMKKAKSGKTKVPKQKK